MLSKKRCSWSDGYIVTKIDLEQINIPAASGRGICRELFLLAASGGELTPNKIKTKSKLNCFINITNLA